MAVQFSHNCKQISFSPYAIWWLETLLLILFQDLAVVSLVNLVPFCWSAASVLSLHSVSSGGLDSLACASRLLVRKVLRDHPCSNCMISTVRHLMHLSIFHLVFFKCWPSRTSSIDLHTNHL